MITATSAYFPVWMAAEWDDVTLDDVEVMRRCYGELHGRGDRFATFVDARRAHVPPASVRRALADMSNSFDAAWKKNAVCTAVILDNPLMVGVLTAIQWFVRSNVNMKYFARATDGLAFIVDSCRAEGLVVPDGAMRFAKKLDAATADQLPALFATVD